MESMNNQYLKFNNTIYSGIKIMKYSEINLAKYVQDLYNEKCKSLIIEIKGDLNIGDIHHADGQKDSMLLKYQISSSWSVESMHFQPNALELT